MDSVLYTLAENIREQNYVIATYYIKLPKETDVFKKASTLAIGQTIGTWIPIPGITDEIREKYGFAANAIVSMDEVVEHLYNRPCQGKIIIDDTLKSAIDEYYKEYGVK